MRRHHLMHRNHRNHGSIRLVSQPAELVLKGILDSEA